ncbi:MAG: sulfotransferase [Thermodesulfobacteriota bacterium]|nr:sulfotransferase [Thermodesulfobacteriota bacterium]
MKTNMQPHEQSKIPSVSESITLVSGLPRSGTSMMMRMLAAGGMPIATDNIRKANEDNPNGYYEIEKIKHLDEDDTWLYDEKGNVIKAIAALLPMLPKDIFYYVIFIQRHMAEILASQKKMLERRGTVAESDVPDHIMAAKYESYLKATYKWLERQDHFHVMYVHFNDILQDPLTHARNVRAFLGNGIDVEKMAQVVDAKLYRQRRA